MRFMHPALQILLTPASWIYTVGVQLRNRRYAGGWASTAAPIPVISVGNITVGGTGKTPMVVEIVRRLIGLGRRPAILTRGYGGTARREADEVMEFRAAVPSTLVVVNPDRVHGAESAAKLGANCAVLDDGFQHRRLHRDLDLVLIDALDPWGGGRVLPAGRLREPLSNLARANLLVITRANQATPAELDAIRRRLFQLSPGATILQAAVEPTGLAHEDGSRESPENLAFSNVLPVCGLGNPRSFLRMIEAMAGRVSAPAVFRDHYDYTPADVRRLVATAAREGVDRVVTTRKDWVKLAPLWKRGGGERPPLLCLETRTTLGSDGATFQQMITNAVEKRT